MLGLEKIALKDLTFATCIGAGLLWSTGFIRFFSGAKLLLTEDVDSDPPLIKLSNNLAIKATSAVVYFYIANNINMILGDKGLVDYNSLYRGWWVVLSAVGLQSGASMWKLFVKK